MSPPLYIPISDPFAVLGITLLLLLIICATILLIFTARKSAQDARRAVRAQNRYQRLFHLNRREEQMAGRRRRDIVRLQKKWASGPKIMVTAPSASSSLRSAMTAKIPPTHANAHSSTIESTPGDSGPPVSKRPSGEFKHSSSLLGIPEKTCPVEQENMRPLPRPLRVGRHSWRWNGRPAYRTIGEGSDSEEDISDGEGGWGIVYDFGGH